MKPPCGKQCPNRSAECKLTCKDWKEYEVIHRAEIEEREKLYKQEYEITSYKRERIEKTKRRIGRA
jgi:hypothetical protein